MPTPGVRHGMTGLGAVLVIFACSRWGTYIAAPPIYITDVLLALGVTNHLLARFQAGPSTQGFPPQILLFVVAFGWGLLRFLLSPTWSVVALRDAVPYLYVATGVFSFAAYSAVDSKKRRLAARLIRTALEIHLVWVVLALTLGARGPTLNENTYVFQIRADVDAALASILAGLALHDLLQGKRRLVNGPVVLIAAWFVTELPTRAGLLSLTTVLAVVLLSYLSAIGARFRVLWALVGLPVLSAITWTALPATTAGARFLAGMGLPVRHLDVLSAQGTTDARLRAWEILLEYWTETQLRFWFGVGFGPDFLRDSRVANYLGAETFEDVRSPHNYLIGTALRTGLIGVLITTSLLLLVGVAILRLRKTLSQEPLVLTCGLTAAALVPPAMVGVVFEAPFGAVPMFWASGVLIAAAHRTSSDEASSTDDRGREGRRSSVRSPMRRDAPASERSSAPRVRGPRTLPLGDGRAVG